MTVLIIEGQQKTRVEVHRALEKRGCRVISAWDAQDVRGFLATHHEEIEVAVVDFSMVASDAELLAFLREKHPALRLLLTVPEHFEGSVPAGFAVMHKPFDVVELVNAVFDMGTPTRN